MPHVPSEWQAMVTACEPLHHILHEARFELVTGDDTAESVFEFYRPYLAAYVGPDAASVWGMTTKEHLDVALTVLRQTLGLQPAEVSP